MTTDPRRLATLDDRWTARVIAKGEGLVDAAHAAQRRFDLNQLQRVT
jgi:hypothetical protein